MSQSDRSPNASALRHRAEHAGASLPALMVAAERVAASIAPGEHGRRRVGVGESFWQFRRYAFGDSARMIDWRRSAKSDRVYVREREWEAAQSVWLWCDASPSMDYGSELAQESKRARADLLAMALAVLLIRGGEHIALMGQNRVARGGRGRLERFAASLLRRDSDGASLPDEMRLPRHAHLILIGDFLSPLEEIERRIKTYAARHISGHMVQVLDPAEEDLPFDGRVRFEGPEREGELLVNRVESVRQRFHARMTARRETLKDIVTRHGWSFNLHRTDRPPETALLAAYLALSAGAR